MAACMFLNCNIMPIKCVAAACIVRRAVLAVICTCQLYEREQNIHNTQYYNELAHLLSSR